MIDAVVAALLLDTRVSSDDWRVRIAVIPDTQVESYSAMAGRARWIARRDFDAVAHVGDVTDWGARDFRQFQLARHWMGLLPDVPRSVAAGNHDTAAVGFGGGAYDRPRTAELLRDTTAFNAAALSEPTRKHRGRAENSWTRINSRWGMLTLEMWPREGVIRWAQRVIDRRPKMRWVVNTHTCLDRTGRIYDYSGYGATSPKHLRDRLVRPNRAVRVVLCGHVSGTHVTRDRHATWILTNGVRQGAVRDVRLTRSAVRVALRRG